MTTARQEAEQELAYTVGKDRAAQLLDAVAAAAYREAADEIDNDCDNCTCTARYTCPTCQITNRLRARADAIHPA